MPRGIYKRTKKSRKMTLTEEEVFALYHGEEKSLAQIGKLGGVTRQRVSQLMKEWGYSCCSSGNRRHKKKFTDLITYLEHCKKTGTQTDYILIRLVKPYMKQCENCGSVKRLSIRRLKRPVTSLKEFKILCSACSFASCRGGIDGIKRKEIYNRRIAGETVKALVKEYRVTKATIYRMLIMEGEIHA